ncbi:LysR family transcriptional regulator [uncultured Aeromicrobium sp.]|uniref:LysR family transcriptional regulator n=1 Tax=uncultured Aeromicrobium sp. TaxID=337820 RepID=UPI0025F932EA|nr:LysR family transcriptional regulator [uncultured Aeromicrobium sp.]
MEILVGLGEDLHFSRAADRLGIAQPTLSKELRRFEKQLTFRDCSAGGRTARG